VNCYQELCIELWSVINFHREIEPANLLQYCVSGYDGPGLSCVQLRRNSKDVRDGYVVDVL
jgi:hypothetical protein